MEQPWGTGGRSWSFVKLSPGPVPPSHWIPQSGLPQLPPGSGCASHVQNTTEASSALPPPTLPAQRRSSHSRAHTWNLSSPGNISGSGTASPAASSMVLCFSQGLSSSLIVFNTRACLSWPDQGPASIPQPDSSGCPHGSLQPAAFWYQTAETPPGLLSHHSPAFQGTALVFTPGNPAITGILSSPSRHLHIFYKTNQKRGLIFLSSLQHHLWLAGNKQIHRLLPQILAIRLLEPQTCYKLLKGHS